MYLRPLALMLCSLCVGCGYFMAGRWQDDPKNWARAFHSTKPADVIVIHSEYWRAAHWTYEAGYVFEVQKNDALRSQLFSMNRLRRATVSEIGHIRDMCFHACPPWFAPAPIDQYEVWLYSDDPHGHFRVLIDTITGSMFLLDYQV